MRRFRRSGPSTSGNTNRSSKREHFCYESNQLNFEEDCEEIPRVYISEKTELSFYSKEQSQQSLAKSKDDICRPLNRPKVDLLTLQKNPSFKHQNGDTNILDIAQDYDKQHQQDTQTFRSSQTISNKQTQKSNGCQSKNPYVPRTSLAFEDNTPSYADSQQQSDRTFISYYQSKMIRIISQFDGETPKPIRKISEKHSKKHQDKEKKDFVFVQFPNHDTDQRRYPRRSSRINPVKFWLGQKIDYAKNGYWLKKQQN